MTTATETRCIHHWIISGASGPTSRGECRKCHAVRDNFKNYTSVVPPETHSWRAMRDHALTVAKGGRNL